MNTDNQNVLNLISKYDAFSKNNFQKIFEDELKRSQEFKDFVSTRENCFARENLYGHLTASALVLNKDFTKVLMTHHKKLNKWLQLGGHADGDPFLQRVAFKEVQEESGIENVSFVEIDKNCKITGDLRIDILPFDFDVHMIPEHKGVPEHYHFDVRFLMTAADETFVVSEESNDLRWISLQEVNSYTSEPSTLRQIKKAIHIIQNIKN